MKTYPGVTNYPLCPRIWVLRLGAWEVYESSFVSDQDTARHLRHDARVAGKVAREVAKDNSK